MPPYTHQTVTPVCNFFQGCHVTSICHFHPLFIYLIFLIIINETFNVDCSYLKKCYFNYHFMVLQDI